MDAPLSLAMAGHARGQKLTGWRKIANALWDHPNDPQIYGWFEQDASAIVAFIERARAAGHRVTPTHLVGRAVAHALRAVPDLNVRLVGDRAIPRPSVDIFFITAIARGRDLSGVKILQADEKPAIVVSAELTRRGRELKEQHDAAFAVAKRTTDRLPKRLLRPVLRFIAWFAGERAHGIPALAIEPSPFGSAMVSSVGTLGLPTGFSPIAWLYRVPLLVVVGEMSDRPVAVDGRVEVHPVLPVTATIDHRYVDGAHIADAFRAIREYLTHPAAFEPDFSAGSS